MQSQSSSNGAESKGAGHGVKETISIEGEGPASDRPLGFRFGRMFPKISSQPMILRLSSCAELGDRMTDRPEMAREDSDIPAGYTYFGQFVDHDITMDTTEEQGKEADDPATPTIERTLDADLVQARSPSLDLDSLYGSTQGARSDLMSGFRFRIGTTTPVPGAGFGASGKALPHDLPRSPDGKAIIGDGRNDENLAVAQTHLMWLKFHNAVADVIARDNPGMAAPLVLETARDLVTRHYQHIVLHDFLPRIIDADVYQDIVVNQNRKVLKQAHGEAAFMPLEFAVAAYRFGHSMVREDYDWNLNFGAPGNFQPIANFRELFRFSRGSGNLGNLPTLPSNWIADFRRLYDLGEESFPNLKGSETGPLNMAKKIDPYLAPALASLPEVEALVSMGLRPFANLAALNLRRGSMRGLPSGQDVSRELSSVKMLTKSQMQGVIDPSFDNTMERLGFYDRTPLFLYILLEARALGSGNRMGPLGSTLLADTFLTLTLTSRTTILSPQGGWSPADAQNTLGAGAPLDSMARILTWIDGFTPIVDPLQDSRNG